MNEVEKLQSADVNLHNSYIADEFSKIILKLHKEYKGITPQVLAAVGCGLLFNAIKNHPDHRDSSNEQVTREMHRLVDDFLDTFIPNMVN